METRRFSASLLFVLTVLTYATLAAGQTSVPLLINYHGELKSPTTGERVRDCNYDMVFEIFSESTRGISLWQGHYTAANRNLSKSGTGSSTSSSARAPATSSTHQSLRDPVPGWKSPLDGRLWNQGGTSRPSPTPSKGPLKTVVLPPNAVCGGLGPLGGPSCRQAPIPGIAPANYGLDTKRVARYLSEHRSSSLHDHRVSGGRAQSRDAVPTKSLSGTSDRRYVKLGRMIAQARLI